MLVKNFILSKRVEKEITELPLQIQKRVNLAFEKLLKDPLLGFKLHGELKPYSKLRIGDYRIIYRFDNNTGDLVIVKVEHRQGVYK